MLTLMTVALLAGAPVSMQYEGSLKDGLKQLAQKSNINLVVIGDLDEKVQLNLPNVDGAEALETIAAAYDLELTRKGAASNLWIVKKAGAGAAVAPVAPVAKSPVPPTPPVAVIPPVFVGPGPVGPVGPVGAVGPVGPVGPVVVATPGVSVDALREAAEQAREQAEEARQQAEEVRLKLESLRNASEDAREKAREALEEAREKAQEAADEAREKEEEAREAAREAAEEAREAELERQEALRESAQAQAELGREKAQLARERAALERHRVSTGGPITVEKNTIVESAVAYGGPVIVEENAIVQGDAVAFGGDVVVKTGAIVDGDAVSFGGSVVREEGALVKGESVSMGGTGFGSKMATMAVMKERTQRHDPDVVGATDERDPADAGRGFAAFLLQFAVFFGLGFVLMMFAPHRMKALEATVRAEPVKNGLAGLLGMVALVPLTAALVVTLIGIPIALMLWIMVALFVPAGMAVIANTLGAKIPTGRMRKTQALVLAVGLLALLLIGRVPGVGPLVLSLAAFVSMGAIIRTRFGQTGKGIPVLDPMQNATAPLL